MWDRDNRRDRKRGRNYAYGAVGGCVSIFLGIITILAVILLIASCLFEEPGIPNEHTIQKGDISERGFTTV